MFQAIPRLDINISQTPLMCYYKSKESFLFYHFNQNKLHHNQEFPKQKQCNIHLNKILQKFSTALPSSSVAKHKIIKYK
jgi:hypothetical protein